MNRSALSLWVHTTALLDKGLSPLVLLLFRLSVAIAFWRAGVVKFDDPYGTHYLFSEEYQVPLLSASVAAWLATWTELVMPWFLVLGLAMRPVAAYMFVYNLIAVISYPALWPHGFWHGLIGNDFSDHKAWGLMLLALLAWGAGRWSLDAVLARLVHRSNHSA